MIENISLATKAEIQEEIESLEKEYTDRQKLLGEKLEEMRTYVSKEFEEINKIAKRYGDLKEEINRREGKNG